jgi:glycosyltransferase involved in cell wall biosynthesis
MHILINAVSSSRHPSGICRHAVSLSRCLAANAEISKVTLLVGAWQAGYFNTSFGLCGPKVQTLAVDMSGTPLSRNWWYLNTLPTLAASCGADVVHLSFPVPIVRNRFRCPVVVSLHDLYPYDIPDNFGRLRALFNRLFLRQCISNVDHIACASDFTAARLRALMPLLSRERAERLYPCVDFNPECCQIPTQMDTRRPFILSVAQHRKNKNIPLLLSAFADLLRQRLIPAETCLVIVGSQGPLTNLIRSTITSMSLENNVVMAGTLPDSELCWLYRNCNLFVASSLIEGFGLPLAEALRCGARIVCSDIPVFREIAGNECFYFSPESATAAAELARVCVLALCRRPPGPRPLDEFSFNAIGRQHVAVYSRLLRKQQGVVVTHSSPADRSISYDSSLL